MKHLSTLLLLAAAGTLNAQSYVLSPTFGLNGQRQVDIATGSDELLAHVLLPDGKLLTAGYGYDINANSFHVCLMKLDTACGVPDPTFGNGGVISHIFQQRTICTDIAVQNDGRIVGVGLIAPDNAGSQQKPGIFRLLADGSVDTSFQAVGFRQALWDNTLSSGMLWKVFTNDDGTILCAGASSGNINGGANAVGLMRFTPHGDFDTTFSSDGISTVPLAAANGTAVRRPDGKVVLVGESYNNGNIKVITLAQFLPDGSPDPNFGNGGFLTTPVEIQGFVFEGCKGAALLPDGRLLVGTSPNGGQGGMLMACFQTDGSLDATYGTNGVSIYNADNLSGLKLVLLPDGSTLQFGNANGIGVIIKRTADGQLVNTFGNGGVLQVNSGFGGYGFHDGLQLPSSRIIALGGAGEEAWVVRLTTDPEPEHFLDLGPDVVGCSNEPVLLDAGAGSAYLWGDGSTEQTFTVTQDGVYTVAVTNPAGCTDQDEVSVTLLPPPFQPVIIDLGAEIVTTSVGQLQWNLNGVPIPGATGSSIVPTVNGTYTVTFTNDQGCSSTSDPVEVTTVGIEARTRPGLMLSPVPAHDRIRITGVEPDPSTPVLAIDLVGHAIALPLVDRNTVDTSTLPAGSYVLMIRTHGAIVQSRFVRE